LKTLFFYFTFFKVFSREQHGFTDVKNLAGGLDLWARTVDPSMRRY
jgi:rhodanese-related sulfurtransferase